jgi:hypothetical protein
VGGAHVGGGVAVSGLVAGAGALGGPAEEAGEVQRTLAAGGAGEEAEACRKRDGVELCDVAEAVGERLQLVVEGVAFKAHAANNVPTNVWLFIFNPIFEIDPGTFRFLIAIFNEFVVDPGRRFLGRYWLLHNKRLFATIFHVCFVELQISCWPAVVSSIGCVVLVTLILLVRAAQCFACGARRLNSRENSFACIFGCIFGCRCACSA